MENNSIEQKLQEARMLLKEETIKKVVKTLLQKLDIIHYKIFNLLLQKFVIQ